MRHFRLPFPLPCLVLAATLQAGCDATIHEYPTAQTSQVIVELNADRMPPDYYKELVYDKDGNHTEKLLEQVPSAEYRISEDFDMRFIVELYRVPTPTDDVDKGTLEARPKSPCTASCSPRRTRCTSTCPTDSTRCWHGRTMYPATSRMTGISILMRWTR